MLVLALDGLEYSYIHNDDFPNLKQVEYGKVRVPITGVGEPSTPIVWVSFVTGEMPDVHGVIESSVYQNRLVNWMVGWLERVLSRGTFRSLCLLLSLPRKLLKYVGVLDQRMFNKDEIKVPTMFDCVGSSISLSVPVLDVDVSIKYAGILDAIIDPSKRRKYIKFLYEDFENDKRMLFVALDKFRLVMCHFQLPDLYGHIYCRDEGKIISLYKVLDEFVSTVKARVSENCWVVVISDHGIDKNFGHTHYGFYSTNVPLGFDCPHITDFFSLILGRCGVEKG